MVFGSAAPGQKTASGIFLGTEELSRDFLASEASRHQEKTELRLRCVSDVHKYLYANANPSTYIMEPKTVGDLPDP